MKKIILALSLFCAPAFAGDAAKFESLGFSPRGQFYAFAQSGTQDGSGFAYADVSVIDVARNKLVAQAFVVLEENGDEITKTPNDALLAALAKVKLGRFGINRGEVMGEELLVRLPTDHSVTTTNLFSFDFWAEGGASISIPKYEVVVSTKEIQSEDEWCKDYGGAQLLKLAITGRDATNGATQVLQEDQRLPRSRSCPLSYAVRRVISYKGGLVVALSMQIPGFEGPDVRYMAVTGEFSR